MRKGDPELERQWRARLQEMASQGVGVTEYARRTGHKYKTIYYWRRRIAELEGEGSVAPEKRPSTFVKIADVRSGAPEVGTLVLRVGERYSLQIGERVEGGALKAVLDVLEARQ